MCQGAVRQSNLISRIDHRAKHRCFRVANGAMEMPLSIIETSLSQSVTSPPSWMQPYVPRAETTYILLGVRFLAQVDGFLRIHPPVLEMTNKELQKESVAVDYSGDSRLHQFDQYAFSCVDQSHHYLSTCSNNEAQYAGDFDSQQGLAHYDYVLSAT
jgi:hypothetical protein